MTNTMKSVKLAFAATVLTGLAACGTETTEGDDDAAVAEAGANEVDLKTHMQLSAAEYLEGAMEDTFTPEQVSILQNFAHQKVVAETCDGFEVDNAKWAAAMGPLIEGKKGDAEITPARLHDQLLAGLSMATGAELAIAAYDQQSFCDGARDERADTELTNPYDIYASAETPAEEPEEPAETESPAE